ncbi:hypothetical protein G6F62_013225 [Rhizopus arrhizus]|nr:hypothetical protein G6F62_013225 [Rhizopus arrhizus]
MEGLEWRPAAVILAHDDARMGGEVLTLQGAERQQPWNALCQGRWQHQYGQQQDQPANSPATHRHDHPVVRIGTRAVIESSGVGRVVGEADSAQALMALLGDQPCDLLVTDYSMPGSPQADGFAMIGMIRRRHPELPVLMLSVSNNLAILRMVLDSGVLGLVDKSSSMD